MALMHESWIHSPRHCTCLTHYYYYCTLVNNNTQCRVCCLLSLAWLDQPAPSLPPSSNLPSPPPCHPSPLQWFPWLCQKRGQVTPNHARGINIIIIILIFIIVFMKLNICYMIWKCTSARDRRYIFVHSNFHISYSYYFHMYRKKHHNTHTNKIIIG